MPSTLRFVTVLPIPAVGPRQYAEVGMSDYPYECSCGEQYQAIEYAVACRKCRVYSLGNRCLYVTDLRTDEMVWGQEPTAEELVEYTAEMERQAEETRDYIAMCEKTGPRYERIMAERAEEAARRLAEERMDNLYLIQDGLMGY